MTGKLILFSERRMDGEDTDDTNLDMLVKTQQAQINAQHNISSIVQNAAAAAVNAVAQQQQAHQGAPGTAQLQQQLQQQLANIQSGHQSIQDQLRAQAAAQLQAVQQQQQQAGQQPVGRSQAEIGNLNLKTEDPDSDCEVVEDNSEVSTIGLLSYSAFYPKLIGIFSPEIRAIESFS